MTDRARARRTPAADRLAAVVNEVSSPILANPAVSVAVGASTGSWPWTVALTVFTGVLPAGVILGGLAARRISDHHVTDRDERPLVMAAILSSLVVGLVATALGGAPAPVIGVVAAMLATLAVLAAVTVVARWKVSVHSAVWAGIAAMLTLTFGWWAVPVLAVVPVVMWGRVRVRDHTSGQVVAGAVTGLLVAGSVFGVVG